MGQHHNYRADLYSFAIVIWVLLTGGVKSEMSPRPPAPNPPFKSRNQLLNNWLLLKECILNPSENDARPLPSDVAKNFILVLTDRSPEGVQKLISHDDIRSHALLS